MSLPSTATNAVLLEAFADASDALFEAGVTRSDSFTGDIGEFVAAATLGLRLVGRNEAVVDARKGSVGYQEARRRAVDQSAHTQAVR